MNFNPASKYTYFGHNDMLGILFSHTESIICTLRMDKTSMLGKLSHRLCSVTISYTPYSVTPSSVAIYVC